MSGATTVVSPAVLTGTAYVGVVPSIFLSTLAVTGAVASLIVSFHIPETAVSM